MNGAQTSPVAGGEPREVMPLVSYRASVEAVLHEIHEVAGRRQSAKQVLKSQFRKRYRGYRPARRFTIAMRTPKYAAIFPGIRVVMESPGTFVGFVGKYSHSTDA